jgi:hypothetical protein
MEVKVYETLGAKVLDFLLGFIILGGLFESVLPLCAKAGSPGLMTVMFAAAFAAALALSIYLYKRRKFMGIGFGLAAVGGPLIVFLTYLLLGLSMGRH